MPALNSVARVVNAALHFGLLFARMARHPFLGIEMGKVMPPKHYMCAEGIEISLSLLALNCNAPSYRSTRKAERSALQCRAFGIYSKVIKWKHYFESVEPKINQQRLEL
jgi:hypothetical protein